MNNEFFDIIDKLFDENKPKEAERFMQNELEAARRQGRMNDALMLLNELIGYYRQTSEKENLKKCIADSISLADQMGLEGSVAYATTMINAGNASRSLGELKAAKEYYEKAEGIYQEQIKMGQLEANDMLVAGLYNNISLMYQELSDFDMAYEYQLKALEIVKFNNAGFELPVTYANIANTLLLAGDYDKSAKYALLAKTLFEKRGLLDPHYCAALSALGNCYLNTGRKSEAKDIFVMAMKIVEDTFGRNSQYERLKESLALCGVDSEMKSGMELAREFYENYGKDMIDKKFGNYKDRIAVGLVGEGSDCYGFDDEYSKDHDYGPGFCMWLDDETYAAIGKDLQREYEGLLEGLPKALNNYSNTTAFGQDRRGVFRVSDFYRRFLNTEDISRLDYADVPEYSLAVCTNGEVFRDDLGCFTSIRNQLRTGFPKPLQFRKIAEDVAGFSQCGQYNYQRMQNRGDRLTANIMLSDFCKWAIKLWHHIHNVYVPHDKWLRKSALKIEGGGEVIALLDGIWERPAETVEQLGSFFAQELYEWNFISDTDDYLDHHIGELMFKADAVRLDHEALVAKIVRLEFTAFDKVQNEGGRASCQNDWPTFSVMRKSQYLTWNDDMLLQYLYDFTREYEKGHNLITEKYGRMMESTAPEGYEKIKENFPVLSEEKKNIIEQIVGIQMEMVEAFAKEHPKIAGNARDLHTFEDGSYNTSYETYLRGEISTYSDKMLQLYAGYIISTARDGHNVAQMIISNTAKLYGFADLDSFEKNAD